MPLCFPEVTALKFNRNVVDPLKYWWVQAIIGYFFPADKSDNLVVTALWSDWDVLYITVIVECTELLMKINSTWIMPLWDVNVGQEGRKLENFWRQSNQIRVRYCLLYVSAHWLSPRLTSPTSIPVPCRQRVFSYSRRCNLPFGIRGVIYTPSTGIPLAKPWFIWKWRSLWQKISRIEFGCLWIIATAPLFTRFTASLITLQACYWSVLWIGRSISVKYAK